MAGTTLKTWLLGSAIWLAFRIVLVGAFALLVFWLGVVTTWSEVAGILVVGLILNWLCDRTATLIQQWLDGRRTGLNRAPER